MLKRKYLNVWAPFYKLHLHSALGWLQKPISPPHGIEVYEFNTDS